MKAEVERLFHQLADLDPPARAQYLDEHPVDEATRREVEALLAHDSVAGSFLTRDIGIAASRALPELECTGYRCGPYRLLRAIGRGGMGAVYLAERADGEVTQRLAIKLLPLGAGDPQRERFLQERQILASLTHPNIARMLDAGHLDNGQPYLVMEYIEGQPVDQFTAGLPIREIVELFLKICPAVAYSHRNLIVHRDLKPANILVTAAGEPKLLDFGIAKMLDLASDSTLTHMRMLTPDYASPEQVTGAPISTAVDVYGLGAVLYRLLTGRSAHDFEGRSPESVVHVVATHEVTRPSRWNPELKGDLECIVMKALRKDPQERYATVEQLADDLRAFLQSRPVHARSADWWYRTRKFVRRYWATVSAAAVVICSLAAGLYIVERQRGVAEERVGQLRRLSQQLLDFETQLSLPGAGSDLNLHRRLAATSIQYLESITRDDLRDRKLALEIATAYLRVARIQGVPEWNQLGQYGEAEKSVEKADEIARTVLAADGSNRDALWVSANAAHDRAVIAYAEHRPEQVLAWSPKVREGFDRLARLGNLTRREINAATYIYGDLAEVHIGLHRFADAVRYARLGIDYSRNVSNVPGPRAQAFNMLAGALANLGDLDGALAASAQARALWEQLRRDEGDSRYTHLMMYQTRCREGLILGEAGGVNLNRLPEAVARLEEAYTAVEDFAQKDSHDFEARGIIALSGRYLGDMLRQSDPRRAFAIYEHSLSKIREVPHDIAARRTEALLLAGSSYAARAIGREMEAKKRIAQAFRLLHETGDYPVPAPAPASEAGIALLALADDSAATGDAGPADDAYRQLRRHFESCGTCADSDLPAAVWLSRLDASLAALLRRTGRSSDADAMATGRCELWRRWDRRLPGNSFVRRQLGAAEAGLPPPL